MGFNRFTFRLALVVVLIFLTALALSFIWPIENKLFTRIFIIVLLILETLWLYRIVSKTNRDLRQFLASLEGDDLSSPLQEGKSEKMFKGLNEAFDSIQTRYFNLRVSKEQEFQLYQKILNQTGSGLLLFDGTSKIILSNPAAKQLLGAESFKDLKTLDQFIPGSKDFLLSLSPEAAKTWNFIRSGQAVELLALHTELKIEGRKHTLISLQDIKKQLSEKAFRSQKNIIRVLSHEINNTLTPITTLADALIRNSKTPETMVSNREDLIEGLDIIRERSNNIMEFVKNYKELSQIPDPDIHWLNLKKLITDMISLNQKLIDDLNIEIQGIRDIQEGLLIECDSKLIGQVLQNILANGMEAIQHLDIKEIELKIDVKNSGDLILSIIDNGPGIPANIREKLFTPFFSTKPGGSGIGLSLSRQIMHLHDGEIDIRAPKKGGTEVALLFRSRNIRSESEQISGASSEANHAK